MTEILPVASRVALFSFKKKKMKMIIFPFQIFSVYKQRNENQSKRGRLILKMLQYELFYSKIITFYSGRTPRECSRETTYCRNVFECN